MVAKLLRCMDINEEYIAERDELERTLREAMAPFAAQCLAVMRSFIPPDVFTISLEQLQDRGVPLALSKRIMTKKCLWYASILMRLFLLADMYSSYLYVYVFRLVRMQPEIISKLHEADLLGRFTPEGQQLDVIESFAVFAALPVAFSTDGNGKKMAWKRRMESELKKIQIPSDVSSVNRHQAYRGSDAVGLFGDIDELYAPTATSSAGAFGPRTSFSELASKKNVIPPDE
jgi:hypothetical protein